MFLMVVAWSRKRHLKSVLATDIIGVRKERTGTLEDWEWSMISNASPETLTLEWPYAAPLLLYL